MTTDAELLQRYARENSDAAFAELVQRHLALVYSTALRQVGGDAHLAQDVAQTVFTALARKAATLTDRATLAGWLYLGTHHVAAQTVRSLRRRRTREQEAHAMHELTAPDSPPADWDRVRPVLDAALRALGEADREAVLLRYFERRPFADIGAALNLSDDAARMRVDRALDKLREQLARHGITSTGAALAAALGQQAMVAAPAGLAATIAGAALTTAAGTTTAAATGFFMSTTTALLSVVALAATGSAVYQFNESRRADEAVAALTSEHAALNARLRIADQRAAETARQNEKLKRDFDQLFTARTAAPAPSAPPAVSIAQPRLVESPSAQTGQLTLRSVSTSNDPVEARRQTRAYNLANQHAANAALYRLLGFTPAQREQYMALVAENTDRHEARWQEAVAQAKAADGKIDRDSLQPIFKENNARSAAELESALTTEFGAAAVQTIQRYKETVPMREVTRELAASLFYTDTPLTPVQAEQMVDVLARNSRNAQGKVDLAAMNYEAIAAQAQAVLAAPQLAALRQAHDLVRSKWVVPEKPRTAAPPPGK